MNIAPSPQSQIVSTQVFLSRKIETGAILQTNTTTNIDSTPTSSDMIIPSPVIDQHHSINSMIKTFSEYATNNQGNSSAEHNKYTGSYVITNSYLSTTSLSPSLANTIARMSSLSSSLGTLNLKSSGQSNTEIYNEFSTLPVIDMQQNATNHVQQVMQKTNETVLTVFTSTKQSLSLTNFSSMSTKSVQNMILPTIVNSSSLSEQRNPSLKQVFTPQLLNKTLNPRSTSQMLQTTNESINNLNSFRFILDNITTTSGTQPSIYQYSQTASFHPNAVKNSMSSIQASTSSVRPQSQVEENKVEFIYSGSYATVNHVSTNYPIISPNNSKIMQDLSSFSFHTTTLFMDFPVSKTSAITQFSSVITKMAENVSSSNVAAQPNGKYELNLKLINSSVHDVNTLLIKSYPLNRTTANTISSITYLQSSFSSTKDPTTNSTDQVSSISMNSTRHSMDILSTARSISITTTRNTLTRNTTSQNLVLSNQPSQQLSSKANNSLTNVSIQGDLQTSRFSKKRLSISEAITSAKHIRESSPTIHTTKFHTSPFNLMPGTESYHQISPTPSSLTHFISTKIPSLRTITDSSFMSFTATKKTALNNTLEQRMYNITSSSIHVMPATTTTLIGHEMNSKESHSTKTTFNYSTTSVNVGLQISPTAPLDMQPNTTNNESLTSRQVVNVTARSSFTETRLFPSTTTSTTPQKMYSNSTVLTHYNSSSSLVNKYRSDDTTNLLLQLQTSSVNLLFTPTPALLTTPNNNHSLLPSTGQKHSVFKSIVAASSMPYDVRHSSVNETYTSLLILPSNEGRVTSINQIAAVSSFRTGTKTASRMFSSVINSSVDIFHSITSTSTSNKKKNASSSTPLLMSPSKESRAKNVSTKMTPLWSISLNVKNSPVIVPFASSLTTPSQENDNFSSLPNNKETETVLFHRSMITASIMFSVVSNSLANISNHLPWTPLSDVSKENDKFSSLSTVNPPVVVSDDSKSKIRPSSTFHSVKNSSENVLYTPPLILPSNEESDHSSVTTITPTQAVSISSANKITASRKFYNGKISSLINMSHTPPITSIFNKSSVHLKISKQVEIVSTYSSSVFEGASTVLHSDRAWSENEHYSLASINQTKVALISSTNMIRSLSMVNTGQGSSVIISYTPPFQSSSNGGNHFSSLWNMNQTKVMFATSSTLREPKYSSIKGPYITPLRSLSKESEDVTFSSTMFQTQAVSSYLKGTVTESKKLSGVKNPSADVSYTPQPNTFLKHSGKLSLLITENKTVKVLIPSKATITASDILLSGNSFSLNVSYTPSLTSSSKNSDIFTTSSNMNQTVAVSVFATRMMAEASMFSDVRNSSINISYTPKLILHSVERNNFTSLSTLIQSERTNSITKVSLGLQNSSVNVSYTLLVTSAFKESNNVSSLLQLNQTEDVSRVSSSMIRPSRMLHDVRNLSENTSYKSEQVTKTEQVSISDARTISIINYDQSVGGINFSVNSSYPSTPTLPSTSSNNLFPLLTINKTQGDSTSSTGTFSASNQFIHERNSSVDLSHVSTTTSPFIPSSNFQSTFLEINKTKVISTFNVNTISSSNMFVGVRNFSVNSLHSPAPTPMLPPRSSNNLSPLFTTNRTQTVSTSYTRAVSTSSQLIDVKNYSIFPTSKTSRSNELLGMGSSSTTSKNLSSLFLVNEKTRPISTFSASKILVSNYVNTSVNAFYSRPSTPPSSLTNNLFQSFTINKTKEITTLDATLSQFIGVNNSSIVGTSSTSRSNQFVDLKNSSVNPYQSSTPVLLPSSTSLFTINTTQAASILDASTISALNQFTGVKGSSINLSQTPNLHNSNNNLSSFLSMNKTQEVPIFATTTISASNSFHSSTPMSPSSLNSNLSSLNNTGAIFSSRKISGSHQFVGVGHSSANFSLTPSYASPSKMSANFSSLLSKNKSVSEFSINIYPKNVSTYYDGTKVQGSTPSTHETANTTQYSAVNRTYIKKITVVPTSNISTTVMSSTTNNLSNSVYPLPTQTTIKVEASSISTQNGRASSIYENKTSFLTQSLVNVNISAVRSSLLAFSNVSNSTGLAFHVVLNHTLTSSQISQIASKTSSISLIKLSGSPTLKEAVNINTSEIFTYLTILPSTHSASKYYSVTFTRAQDSNQTLPSTFPTNITTSTPKFPTRVNNSSAIDNDKVLVTSILSNPLTVKNISTKAIQPTSVLPSAYRSTVRLPIALSKQRVMSCNATITNRVYTSELSDSSSSEYIELAREVQSTVSSTKVKY